MKPSTWVLIILFTGLVLRVLWWGYAQPVPVSDFETYHRLAVSLFEHQQLGDPQPTAYRLPGFPIFLAAMMMISPSVEWLSLANVFLSTLLIFLVYRLAFLLTGETQVSLLAAAICALNPTFIFYSPVLASEHLYVALLLSSLLLLLVDPLQKSGIRMWRFILAGILYGAAILTRGDGLSYLPLIMIVAYFSVKVSPHRYYPVLVFILSFVIIVFSWLVRNRILIGPGAGFSTESGVNFYYAHNDYKYGFHPLVGTALDGLNELERHQHGYQLGFEYLTNAPVFKITRDIAWGTVRLFLAPGIYSVFWSTRLPREGDGADYPAKNLSGIIWFYLLTLTYYILFLDALLSCFLISRYPPKTWLVLFGIVVLNWIGFSWIFWSTSRYRYVAEVVFCILGSMLINNVAKHIAPYLKSTKFTLASHFI